MYAAYIRIAMYINTVCLRLRCGKILSVYMPHRYYNRNNIDSIYICEPMPVYFKRMMKELRPAYNPPHRRLLSGQLLDKEHAKMEKRNSELIAKMNDEVVLLVDGWQNSSSNRHYVVTMLATSDDQKVFLEAFDFSGLRETSVNLIDAVEKSITLGKERYGAKIYAVLSDNANNMKGMGAGIETLQLLYSTCNAHTGNLLAGDILKKPQHAEIMANAMMVQKVFRKTGLEDRLLKAGGHKAELSCATRWTSQQKCYGFSRFC